MTSSPLDSFTTHKELSAEVKACDGQRGFSRKHGVPRTTLQDRLAQLKEDQFKHRPAPSPVIMGQGTGRRRYILSSAQDGTRVHESFLANLEAYADWLGADAPCDLLIAGYTYNKSLFEDHGKKTPLFHERVQPYLRNERMRLCEGLDFCAETNTLPTAPKPLSRSQTYTQERWAVFPHAKVQLVSVPTMKHEPSKIIMSTGSVTMPNYVPKQAGLIAVFHHQIAAVLVEIDDDEEFFCRHLIADEDGSFYDLDRYVSHSCVTDGHRIECLTPGDIHVAQIDPETAKATFGFWPVRWTQDKGYVWEGDPNYPSMLKKLRPHNVFIHDVSDFRARNHHEIKDPHTRFKTFIEGRESVEDELRNDALFITHLSGLIDGQLFVVESNHHEALDKWLKTTTHFDDPPNALFYLRATLAKYEAMERGDHEFDSYHHVMKTYYDDWRCKDAIFLPEDGKQNIGGVEHAIHGHRGANGTRGSVSAFTRIGPKCTIGHMHSAAIIDGVYVTGTTSKLDLGYNKGASSWSHSHCVQYKNGKRTIITLKNGRWKI